MKWSRGRLDDAVIMYVHRGAPGDVMEVTGRDVREVAHGWLVLGSGPTPSDDATARSLGGERHIPWHRVLRIELDGRPVWTRRPDDAGAPHG